MNTSTNRLPMMYRLMSMPLWDPAGVRPEFTKKTRKLAERYLWDSQVVNIDNVVEHLIEKCSNQKIKHLELPKCLPAWPIALYCWEEPGTQLGLWSMLENWQDLKSTVVPTIQQKLRESNYDPLPESLETAEWMAGFWFFFTKWDAPFNGYPCYYPMEGFALFNKEGFLQDFFSFPPPAELPDCQAIQNDFRQAVWYAMFANAFAHCKNVECTSVAPPVEPKKIRRICRQTGHPEVQFHVLKIGQPVARRHSGANGGEPTGIVMSQHIRRGNFATYKAPKLLWGKYEGTVYRPATVVNRGRKEKVNKTYVVEPPSEPGTPAESSKTVGREKDEDPHL